MTAIQPPYHTVARLFGWDSASRSRTERHAPASSPGKEAPASASPRSVTLAVTAEQGAPKQATHDGSIWDFDVAISYAGSQRTIAAELASLASSKGIRVFYDKEHASELWGEDLTTKLDEIYRVRSRFCLPIVCGEYARREWTRHELRSARARALREKGAYILPVRLEAGLVLDGVPDSIGYLSLHEYSLTQIVDILFAKLQR